MPEFAHGLVLGKFYPFHAGHALLIRTALARCDVVTVEVLGSSAESISMDRRVGWIRAEFPGAHVVCGLDDAAVDFDSAPAWDAHMTVIEALLDAAVDAVFTSDVYGGELARRLNATWVQVNPDRAQLPISASAIRADPDAHWSALPPLVRTDLIRRVVVLGAESTGSTTLAADLAAALGTDWVPEYGREYTETRDGGPHSPWRTHEFDLITDRQIAMERAAAATAPRSVLVCDTDALATTLWHERYVGHRAQRLELRAAAHPPVLYLLTGDEIPFVQDGWRDGEHLRHAMQDRFRETLAAQPVPWIEVRGTPAQRTATALDAVGRELAATPLCSAPLPQRGTGIIIR
ncbi:cytidyltransferase [Mycobacterium sp. E802]|uniref:AAA family ATPase n=1 Tax=Mycobacterium sp. E802 TaxID=1834152 RepID=UPI0007FD3084|nr:AAA family ATPase [Mycobacterium sp. E802]OBG79950.1 cytidyltransferase [Mycobacterium sp. E802]